MLQWANAQICKPMDTFIMEFDTLLNSVMKVAIQELSSLINLFSLQYSLLIRVFQRRDNFFQGLAQFDRDDWPLERQYLEGYRQISHAISLELNVIRQFVPNILVDYYHYYQLLKKVIRTEKYVQRLKIVFPSFDEIACYK